MPRRWSLWSLPTGLKRYVLAVDLAALAVVAATATLFPVERQDLLWFGGLALAAMLHYEASRRIERIREVTAEGVTYVDLQSVWHFAALLLLPPPLAVALIAITYTHMWFRVSKRIVVHRWVFSACTVVLASGCAAVALAVMAPGVYPGLPTGWGGLAAIAVAGVVRWFVNYALVVGAIVLASGMTVRKALGRPADQFIEAAALGLGYLVALAVVSEPAAVLVLMIPLLVMQQSLMISQLEHAASRDAKTGLLTAMYWHELAKKELERASRLKTSVGILMIDLDRFKEVNRKHGQPAGDVVLRAVAKVVRAELRHGDDQVARLAGEEFVALLPGISDEELPVLAERICERVRELAVDVEGDDGPATVRNLTISVGGAMYPDSAADLDELLLIADNALFSAKDSGRDGFCVVSAGATG